jgi:hypothetical protein
MIYCLWKNKQPVICRTRNRGADNMLNNLERTRINLWCTKIVALSIFIIDAHKTPFVVIITIETKRREWREKKKRIPTGRVAPALLRPRRYSFAWTNTSVIVIEYHEQVTTVKFNLLPFKIASVFNLKKTELCATNSFMHRKLKFTSSHHWRCWLLPI